VRIWLRLSGFLGLFDRASGMTSSFGDVVGP
jgi:hypothetical protein